MKRAFWMLIEILYTDFYAAHDVLCQMNVGIYIY